MRGDEFYFRAILLINGESFAEVATMQNFANYA